jgi:hypothetical protein
VRAAPESTRESSSSCRAVGSKWVAETKIGGRELRSRGLVVVVAGSDGDGSEWLTRGGEDGVDAIFVWCC